MTFIDISGEKYGRLTAIKRLPKENDEKTKWLCKCDCGEVSEVNLSDLRAGKTKSCGCFRRELTSKMRESHKKTDTRLYSIWSSMKTRCYNPKSESYPDYGGRGIKVCDKWKENFEEFYHWANKNGYREHLTLDRIENDENYCPENCRWATGLQQGRNKRNNIIIKINNSERLLLEWCEIFGIRYDIVYGRIRWGWNPIKALVTPEGDKK